MDIYTVSNSTKSELENILKKKINLLPFIVNTDVFYPVKKRKNNKFTVIFVGRIELEKNINEIIELQNFFNFTLLLVGKGNEIDNIKRKHKNKDILYMGNVNNNELYKYYNYADLFINPSKTETMGFTTLEAMACKLLVLGRNENGTKDIIKHNQNGLLYNNFEELKFYFNKIYQNKNDFEKIYLIFLSKKN